jgi:hypothetical protein
MRNKLVIFGAMSGFWSAFGAVLNLDLLHLAPGFLYGCSVALPWSRACKLHTTQSVGLVIMSVVGYTVALHMTLGTDFLLSPVAGGLGAAIMLLPALRFAWDPVRKAMVVTVATGAAAGCVFLLFSGVQGGWWGMFLGIGLWQTVTAYSLSLALPAMGRS